MKKVILIVMLAIVSTINYAQISNELFLNQIINNIVAPNAPYFYLQIKYAGYLHWTNNLGNSNVSRPLSIFLEENGIKKTKSITTTTDTANTWICKDIKNARCLSIDSSFEKLHDRVFIKGKWWWGEGTYFKNYNKKKNKLAERRKQLPAEEKVVYIINEPWVVANGKYCLVYNIAKYDNNQSKEKIDVFEYTNSAWTYVKTLQD
jgi:hypothetical protein